VFGKFLQKQAEKRLVMAVRTSNCGQKACKRAWPATVVSAEALERGGLARSFHRERRARSLLTRTADLLKQKQ
jgi:hypothetical protein